MNEPGEATRRTVLKTVGGSIVAGSSLTGLTAARDDDLVARIDSDGHYAAFPDDARLWQRSENSIDLREFLGTERWLVEPTAEGAVRMQVENDVPLGNVGFDITVGRLGDIEAFTIDAETVETAEGEEATLWVAVYFDAGGTGDFFEWAPIDDATEYFAGFGDDTECLQAIPVNPEGVTIDTEFEWGTLAVPSSAAPEDAEEKGWIVDEEVLGVAIVPEGAGVTLEDYTEGEVTIGGDRIDLGTDADTNVAIAVNCLAGGKDATEEIIVSGIDQ